VDTALTVRELTRISLGATLVAYLVAVWIIYNPRPWQWRPSARTRWIAAVLMIAAFGWFARVVGRLGELSYVQHRGNAGVSIALATAALAWLVIHHTQRPPRWWSEKQ